MPDLDPVVAVYYDQHCKMAYQGHALLRRAVRTEPGVVGNTAEFPRISRGLARPHVPAAPRVALGATFVRAVCTLTAWDATEYSDDLDRSRIRFDDRPAIAGIIGGAMGRREDQVVLDAMIAAHGTATIAQGGVGMTEGKLRNVVRLLDTRAVPQGNRFLVVSSRGYDDIRTLSVAASRDFGESAVGRTGVLPQIYGLSVILIDEARPEGGLPIASGNRQCFAFDREAVGLAIAEEQPLRTEWVPHLAAWQLSMRARFGGVVIDPEGILRVDILE